jgi:hypothetical protein
MTCNAPLFKFVGVEGMRNLALFVTVLNLLQQCEMQLYLPTKLSALVYHLFQT